MGRKREPQPKQVRRTPAGKFGRHLQSLLEDRNLTPKDFATKIGKSEDAVWSYLRGTRTPHIDEWPGLARALGLSSIRDLVPDWPV